MVGNNQSLRNKNLKKNYNLILKLIGNTENLELKNKDENVDALENEDFDGFESSSSVDDKFRDIRFNSMSDAASTDEPKDEEVEIKRALQLSKLRQNYDLNEPDEENTYLLHWAVRNERLELVKYLLEVKGAKVDSIGHGELGATPMHCAAKIGNLSIVSFLMKKSADLLSINNNDGFAPIHAAIASGNLNVVAYFLANGIDVIEIIRI